MYRGREFERYIDESSFIRLERVRRIATITPGCCARNSLIRIARMIPRCCAHLVALELPGSLSHEMGLSTSERYFREKAF
jgi:hypothetical protein